MKSNNPDIDLLFARLEWPSLMVRERAAAQIVALLADPALREVIGEALVAWLSSRELESLATNGLVVPLRLKADGFEVFPDVDRLVAAVRYPSALSHLLTAELRNSWEEPSHWREWHSGAAPNGFMVSPYFERYKRGFVPPIYEERAREIESRFLVSFQRQWAYEWERILQRTNVSLSGSPSHFMRSYDQTLVYCDVPQSEVYRSAYLRALAWTVDKGGVPPDLAQIRALECCPIDVGIWKINPSSRPAWWPQAETPKEGLDTTPGQVWPQVEALWKEQQQGTLEQLLVHASGPIFTSEMAICDLEIYGAFQRFEGGEEPRLADVSDWLAWQQTTFPVQMKATLSGPIQPEPVDRYVRQFAGWSLAPTAVRIESWTTPRWQAHRMYRGVWTAAPYLVERKNELVCDSEFLKLQSGKHTVAQWQTWHDHLKERWYANVPPGMGECLWIDRGLIRNFCEATKSSFCWVARLRFYHRRYASEAFKPVDDIRAFGASHLFLVE